MFCLAQEVSSDKVRIAGVVCKHEHFGRACHHVDIDNAKNFLLSDCGKDVTRAHNLIDAFHNNLALAILGTVSEHTDSLSATDVVNLSNAEFAKHKSHSAVDFALDRSHDNDVLDASNNGRNRIHNDRARVNASTTWNIKTHTLHRTNTLTENHAVLAFHEPRIFHLVHVEITNILNSLLESALHFGRALGGRLLDFGFGDAEVLAFEAIELLGVFNSLGITAVLDVGENVHDLVVNFLARSNFTTTNSVNLLRLRSDFYDFHFNRPSIFKTLKPSAVWQIVAVQQIYTDATSKCLYAFGITLSSSKILYVRPSTKAVQQASMMLLETPTMFQ